MMFTKSGYDARWVNVDKDGGIIVPDESKKSPNSFETDFYHVTLNEFDKLQYRLLNTRYGHRSDFVAFTKVKDEIFMVTMSKSDFETKKSEINCNLAEKDRILNGLKQPNTIIVDEDRNRINYANFPGKQVEDHFNLATEDEVLKRETKKLTMLKNILNSSIMLDFDRSDDKWPVNVIKAEDLKDANIRLYGRMLGISSIIDNWAIRFLSDTKVLCTGFDVTMKSKDNYRILLEETTIDLEKVYEQLQAQNAFKWDEKDCLPDPDKKTLCKVEKKRQILIAHDLIRKIRNLIDDRERD